MAAANKSISHELRDAFFQRRNRRSLALDRQSPAQSRDARHAQRAPLQKAHPQRHLALRHRKFLESRRSHQRYRNNEMEATTPYLSLQEGVPHMRHSNRTRREHDAHPAALVSPLSRSRKCSITQRSKHLVARRLHMMKLIDDKVIESSGSQVRARCDASNRRKYNVRIGPIMTAAHNPERPAQSKHTQRMLAVLATGAQVDAIHIVPFATRFGEHRMRRGTSCRRR